MSEGFELIDREVGAKIIAKSGSKAEEFRDAERFGKDFIFDADKDFLLRGTSGEIAIGGTVADASEPESLFAV